MTLNYYQLLKVSNTATQEEIEDAYSNLKRNWKHLQQKQDPEARKRSDKILEVIEKAYSILSNPAIRAQYDKQISPKEQKVKIPVPLPVEQIEENPSPAKKQNKTLYSVIILVIILMIGALVFYFQFNNQDTIDITAPNTPTPKTTKPVKPKDPIKDNSPVKENVKPSSETSNKPNSSTDKTVDSTRTTEQTKEIKPVVQEDQTNKEQPADNNELKLSLDAAKLLKEKNANNPQLKAIAKNIANDANKHIDVIINSNTKFLGASSSNQNVTLKFMVIDGISYSKSLLDAYIAERFFYDNQICNTQKADITRGNLFTFAYYNSRNELLGSYYIDQQVCDSPENNRLIKSPDKYQLDSIEM